VNAHKGTISGGLFGLLAMGLWGTSGLALADDLVLDGLPPISTEALGLIRDYGNADLTRFVDWTGDGQHMVITTRSGETRQLFVLEAPGGELRQITDYPDAVWEASYSPAPERDGMIFIKDQDGDERYQLYYRDMSSGTVTPLTDGNTRNTHVLWANKGDRFAFTTNARNGLNADIFIGYPDRPGEVKPLFTEAGAWVALDWDQHDQRLLVMDVISATRSRMYVLDLRNYRVDRVNRYGGPALYTTGRFANNSYSMYLVSDVGEEFAHLYYYRIPRNINSVQLKPRKLRDVTRDIPWDIKTFDMSPDGNWLAYIVNDDGVDRVGLYRTSGGKHMRGPELPMARVDGIKFNPDSKRLAITINAAAHGRAIYTFDVDTRELVRWFVSTTAAKNSDRYVEPELIHYPTFDQDENGDRRQIPAFIYRPEDATGPVPVIVYIHGGPESQVQPFFSRSVQTWVNELGAAVVAPNVRGSTGYGRTYTMLDNGFKREDAVKDIGALLDWISEQKDLDASRVGLYGASYGGYMALATMARYPERVCCGVNIAGISNFMTFLNSLEESRKDLRRTEYGNEQDPAMAAFLNRISPTTNAASIRAPLMVVGGLNDPRVPHTEAEQIVRAVRNGGGTVWYVLARDEGHVIRRSSNIDTVDAATLQFFRTWLAGNTRVTQAENADSAP